MDAYLTHYFFALNLWITCGCPEHPVFRESDAVCGNLERYFNVIPYDKKRDTFPRILKALNFRFLASGLPTKYPFNKDEDDFLLEDMEGTHWRNQKRLAFVIANASGIFSTNI